MDAFEHAKLFIGHGRTIRIIDDLLIPGSMCFDFGNLFPCQMFAGEEIRRRFIEEHIIHHPDGIISILVLAVLRIIHFDMILIIEDENGGLKTHTCFFRLTAAFSASHSKSNQFHLLVTLTLYSKDG